MGTQLKNDDHFCHFIWFIFDFFTWYFALLDGATIRRGDLILFSLLWKRVEENVHNLLAINCELVRTHLNLKIYAVQNTISGQPITGD